MQIVLYEWNHASTSLKQFNSQLVKMKSDNFRPLKPSDAWKRLIPETWGLTEKKRDAAPVPGPMEQRLSCMEDVQTPENNILVFDSNYDAAMNLLRQLHAVIRKPQTLRRGRTSHEPWRRIIAVSSVKPKDGSRNFARDQLAYCSYVALQAGVFRAFTPILLKETFYLPIRVDLEEIMKPHLKPELTTSTPGSSENVPITSFPWPDCHEPYPEPLRDNTEQPEDNSQIESEVVLENAHEGEDSMAMDALDESVEVVDNKKQVRLG